MTLPTTFMTEGNTYVRYLVVFSLASNPTDILTAFTSNIQGQAEGYPRIYCLDWGMPVSPAVGETTYSAATE